MLFVSEKCFVANIAVLIFIIMFWYIFSCILWYSDWANEAANKQQRRRRTLNIKLCWLLNTIPTSQQAFHKQKNTHKGYGSSTVHTLAQNNRECLFKLFLMAREKLLSYPVHIRPIKGRHRWRWCDRASISTLSASSIWMRYFIF